MRKTSLITALTLTTVVLTAPALAQRTPRNGQTGNSVPTASDTANPVKRTWDFTKRFAIPRTGPNVSTCGNGSVEFLRFIAEYNQRVDQFLAGPTDAKKLNLERKNYVKQVLATQRDIAAYLATFEETGKRGPESYVPSVEQDLCRARDQLQSLIAIREGLKAMARVYPDMAEVAPQLAQANAAIARIGDEKALQKFVSANRAASLATVRMKPAVASNPAWEKGLRDGFARLVPGETILRLNLYSSSWYVHKHELTGIPEYRQIGAWVATKRPDGSCWINGVDLWQNFDGVGYDAGEYRLGQAPRQILCENI